jgi:serine/threonine protein phosphatase 1
MKQSRAGVEPARYTYAIGDVHGRLDLVKSALTRISAHARQTAWRVVFLGDYVDRGPQSRAVVELLMEQQRTGRVICLKGNHEALMLEAVTTSERSALRQWLDNGGDETLRSYGLTPDTEGFDAIPSGHIRWMSGLPLTTADPHRIYVHAGLLPRTATHRQSEQALLWIRERFLKGAAEDFEAHVVHGHTPVWAGKPDPSFPELLAHRTNLDSAAFTTGVLTVGVFDAEIPGGPVEVLRIVGEPAPHLAPGLVEPAHGEAASAPRRRIGRLSPW